MDAADAPPLAATALGLIAELLDPAETAPEAKFLRRLRDRADDAGARPGGGPGDARLVALAERFDLARVEVLTVALAQAIELEPGVGQAIAFVQAPGRPPRPTLGLLAGAFAGLAPPVTTLARLAGGPAAAAGLLVREGKDLALAEQCLRVPAPLALALAGAGIAWPGTRPLTTAAAPLPASWRDAIGRQAEALRAGHLQGLVLEHGDEGDVDAVAAALAGALGRRAVRLERAAAAEPGFALFAELSDLLPVLDLDAHDGRCDDGLPRLLATTRGRGAAAPAGFVRWRLPPPPAAERATLWQGAGVPPPTAAALAAGHRVGPARIVGTVAAARHLAAAEWRPFAADVLGEARRRGPAQSLGGHARLVEDAVPAEVLVLPPHVLTAFDALVARCRARETLAERLGPAGRVQARAAVRALFTGPSGTGKSLAAARLATVLGLPLYRVDLAAVSSKYIGETEKNLDRALDAAEALDAVLLFDEADALFARRTEVKDAHDRYANQQTNFLLQRLEAHDGIVVLTSNTKGRIDAAFSRRLDAVIEFPPPSADDRRRLWQAHLGDDELTAAELNRLAATADLAGGHVRNAALNGAAAAAAAERAATLGDYARGLVAEYQKLGRPPPAALAALAER